MTEIGLSLLVAALLLVGMAGIFIPFVPGIALVFAGILIYALATNFAAISLTTVIILGVVAAGAGLLDFYGSAIGAKAGGGKRWAMLGAIIGTLVGVLGGPGGMVVGALAGAAIGAWYEGNDWQKSVKIAAWSVVGAIASSAVQFIIATAMIITFLLAVWL